MEFNIFIQGLKHLKGYFPNWNFDITNMEIMKIWYLSLEKLSNEEYSLIIQEYCKKEQFAPNSPNSILKYCTFKNSEEVFNWLEMLNDQFPYQNEYTKSKFYQELSKDEIAYKVFKDINKAIGNNLFFDKEILNLTINGLEMFVGYEWIKNLFINNYDIAKQLSNPIYKAHKLRENNNVLNFESKNAIEYNN